MSYILYLFRYKLPHFDCLGISRFFKGPPSPQFPVAVNLHSRILPDHVTFSHVIPSFLCTLLLPWKIVCYPLPKPHPLRRRGLLFLSLPILGRNEEEFGPVPAPQSKLGTLVQVGGVVEIVRDEKFLSETQITATAPLPV